MADRAGAESNPDRVRRLALTQDLPPPGLHLVTFESKTNLNFICLKRLEIISITQEMDFILTWQSFYNISILYTVLESMSYR